MVVEWVIQFVSIKTNGVTRSLSFDPVPKDGLPEEIGNVVEPSSKANVRLSPQEDESYRTARTVQTIPSLTHEELNVIE